jgi:hypothetical protein
MVSRVQVRRLAAVRSGALGLAAAIAACSHFGAGGGRPLTPDCDVQVLLHAPGEGYVELGEMSFEAIVADPTRRPYTNPHVLAADAREQICTMGGDTLVADQNAAGAIVHATVYRHVRELEPAPPSRPPADRLPSRSELCDPACGPGQTCEGGACVAAPAPDPAPACADPPCASR